MTTDYGGGRRKRVGPSGPTILIGAVLLVAAFLVGSWLWHRPREILKAQDWAISGPPCPELSRQAFEAQPLKIKERFENNDITFGRNHGHVSCDDIVNDGGKGFGTFTECQFTGPGSLQVTTKAGDAYFLPKLGPATVTVKAGKATCVMAGNYRGK